jgi:hypothetical protein
VRLGAVRSANDPEGKSKHLIGNGRLQLHSSNPPAEFRLVIRSGFNRRQQSHDHTFLPGDLVARVKVIRPPANQALGDWQVKMRSQQGMFSVQ